MKKIIAIIASLITSTQLFATFSIDWRKQADTNYKTGTMIARDVSDNVIVTGFTATAAIYTRKYSKYGDLKWERIDTSGVHSNYEKPMWVNTDTKKNIYITGYRYSFASSWEYPNAIVVIKYNSSGVLLWRQVIPLAYVVGSSTGLRFNLECEMDANNNLYIGTAGTSPSGMVLIKLNSSGTTLFNVVHNFSSIHGFASMRLKNNKIVLTGTASYNQNMATVGWDTTGNFLWSDLRTGYSGSDVEMDGSGNSYILTSYPNQVSPSSGNDIVIHKFNAAGNYLTQYAYDFGGTELSTKMTLVNGKISIIGYGTLNGAYLDWITFQINTTGTKYWDARYNMTTHNDERPRWIVAKKNGDVFVCGQGGPPPSGSIISNLSYVVLKYSNTGTMQWLDTSAYAGGGIGIAATLAKDSSLYVLGYSSMTVTHYLDHTGAGTCGIPSAPGATNITSSGAHISWPVVSGAYLYHLRYKTTTATVWTTVSTNASTYNITNLSGGTLYDYGVEAICSSGPSGYTASQTFTTSGVGYCTTGGVNASQDALGLVWIGAIQIGYTGTNGYYDFTNLSTNLTKGTTQNGYVSGGGANNEFFSIWIDYNQNNDFNDPGELVWALNTTSSGWQTVSFVVPQNAMTGATRMRVTMKRDSAPASCGSYALGQTEDFLVNIIPLRASFDDKKVIYDELNASVYPNPASEQVFLELTAVESNSLVELYDATGKLLQKKVLQSKITEFDFSSLPKGIYLFKIMSGAKTIQLKTIKQ